MQLHYEPITLDLSTPFRIAHGTSYARHNVLVTISDGQHVGRGEAAPVRQHHGRRKASWTTWRVSPWAMTPSRWKTSCRRCRPAPRRRARPSTWPSTTWWRKSWGCPSPAPGLNPARAPQTSFTISIGSPEEVADKARRRAGGSPSSS